MDIGFAGEFWCLRKSVNSAVHPDWNTEEKGDFVRLQKTDFDIVFANDIREDARTAWLSYFSSKLPNAKEIYHLESIVELVKRAKSGEKVFPDNIDIVTGGFPCQDFSVAGKHLGFGSQKSHTGNFLQDNEPTIENRGHLYIWMREVISLTFPKMFVAENVKGLAELGNIKEIIERDFANARNGGYLVVPAQVLFAPDYGVPQTRERVFFIGFRKNALNPEALEALSSPVIPQNTPRIRSQHMEKDCSQLSPAKTLLLGWRNLKFPPTSPNKNTQKRSIWENTARGRQRFLWENAVQRYAQSIMATSNSAGCLQNTGERILRNCREGCRKED